MELIILNDGLYNLVSVTKDMVQHIKLFSSIECMDLCEILRIELSTYAGPPFNKNIMNDGSGYFYGCICN
tara:strand:- start:297 stop:506 length:210 start_codon:yes stop_codon:yes gene_type:complete